MTASGLLLLDIAGYGGLSVTDKGQALLRGEESFARRADPPKKRTAKTRGEVAAEPLDEADAVLLDALKRLRLKLAKEREVPAYVIFSDRTLADMARRKPVTDEAFGEVYFRAYHKVEGPDGFEDLIIAGRYLDGLQELASARRPAT